MAYDSAQSAQSATIGRLNVICPYFTMFKLSVPLGLIDAHPAASVVLDPFCGRGTTLFAARMRGRSAIGIDINPVACAITRAKMAACTQAEVIREAESALEVEVTDIPTGPFWELCYHQATLREICAIREYLLTANGAAADVLRGILLGILHGPLTKVGSNLSNQMPRTYATKPGSAVRFWNARNLKPPPVSALAAIRRRAAHLLAEVPEPIESQVYQGDAGEVLSSLDAKADLVITSPPYVGLRTYVSDQWLRAWFIGGEPEVIYRCPGQLGVQSESKFVQLLAKALSGAHHATVAGADAYFLLGAIPSVPADARELMNEALKSSDGWALKSTRSCGNAASGRRQAPQFGGASNATEEYLFHLSRVG